MMGTCAYPGCGWGFERKRSDARYCSDTCRAKASKDRARARREGGGTRTRRERGAPVAGPGEDSALAERLATMEERLAAAEAGVARAEADRAGWKKVRDQLRAALARVGEGAAAPSPDAVTAAVRAEVGPQLAKLAKRLDDVEAAQAALGADLAKLKAVGSAAKAEDLMMVGTEVGKLNTRVRVIERDLRSLGAGIAAAVDEVDSE